MLDLEVLIEGLEGLAVEIAQSAEETARQRERAAVQLEAARSLPGLREAMLAFGRDMAVPVAGSDMGRTYDPDPAEDYTVIATDGSQIAPDFHHVAPWYVVNPGCAVFRYGGSPDRDRCRLSAHPVLRPPPRASHPAAGEGSAADAAASAMAPRGPLEVERLEEELKLAVRLLCEEADPGRTVLLLDGPLVQWRMFHDIQPREQKERLLDHFRQLMSAARETRTAVAGFISRSRSVEWVTLLRFSLCPQVAASGALCDACCASLLQPYYQPAPGDHHASLAGLRDVELAGRLLTRPGMRTEVVELRSRPWDEITQGAGTAGFFYINTGDRHTGGEIAKVELPHWVWEDRDLMDRLHSVLVDQCETGRGYPMVLSEAHEAAVVRSPDREAFYILIERLLDRHGVEGTMPSAKAMSKRRPLA